MTWDYGRRLMSYDNISYTYDANGIRYTKTMDGVTTHYFTNGTQILGQYDGNLMMFYYGVDGITGFSYNGTNYTYKKNILGDIIGIYKEDVEIVRYMYDAFGVVSTKILASDNKFVDIDYVIEYNENVISTLDEQEKETIRIVINDRKFIAEINPFRYRGYYYDIETGLYYLNSRYYDPETGRFINADDISILNTAKDEINGLNLYAYCFNNPINDTDANGNWSLKKVWKKVVRAVVVVVVATVAVAATVATLGTSSILIAGIVAAAANTLGQVLIQGKSFSQVDWIDVGTTFFSVTIAAYVPGGLLAKSFTETFVNATLNNVFKGQKTTISEFILDFTINSLLSYASDALTTNVNRYVGKTIFKSCIKGLDVSTGAVIYKNISFINEQIIDALFAILGRSIGG